MKQTCVVFNKVIEKSYIDVVAEMVSLMLVLAGIANGNVEKYVNKITASLFNAIPWRNELDQV